MDRDLDFSKRDRRFCSKTIDMSTFLGTWPISLFRAGTSHALFAGGQDA